MRIWIYAVSALFGMSWATAWGQTLYIECPVSQVRADVATKLPEGWWYTPTEGRLRGLRVQTIGGERVLVCLYQAFDGQVAIMQKPPAGVGACYAEKKQQRFACQSKGGHSSAAKPGTRKAETKK